MNIRLITFSTFIFISQFGWTSEQLYIVEQSKLQYDTFVRVEMPGRIIESDDATLINQQLSSVISLRYVGEKQVPLNREFKSEEEIVNALKPEFCNSRFPIVLRPIRDTGKIGTRSLDAQVNPQFVSVNGIHVTNKGRRFTLEFSCR